MWHLFLDESGDLGFDFVNKKPSHFFTICILATSEDDSYYTIRKAIKTTLHRKINRNKPVAQFKNEIKATETPLQVKKYFYEKSKGCKFGIFSVTLNKPRVFTRLIHEKDRIYNYIARKVLDQIPFEKAGERVQLTIDKSKGKREIQDFNCYIIRQLKGRLDPRVPLKIDHIASYQDAGLQAADLFAWGILRKYERDDLEWFNCYAEKVLLDELFLG